MNVYETGQKKRILKTAVLATGLAVGLVGCGVGNAPAEQGPSEKGVVASVDVPLREPAWSEEEGVVLALQEDGQRLVRLDTGQSFDGTRDFPVTISDQIEAAAGENMALERGRTPGKIYLPKPERDQIAVAENDSLLEVRTFAAGESPTRVALGGTSTGLSSQTLYALSQDGQTVSVVDLEDAGEVAAEVEVGASEDALIEASGEDGFWLAGPDGLALYEGSPPELRGSLPLQAGSLAVDTDDPQRAYAGDTESGQVTVVEPAESGELSNTAETDLGAPAEYLTIDEGRLYAVTNDELVVLDSETLETVETVELGPLVAQEDLEEAEPSGLAVGEEDVYVTLRGEPYVLLIEKP
jgi:hypothetical protein